MGFYRELIELFLSNSEAIFLLTFVGAGVIPFLSGIFSGYLSVDGVVTSADFPHAFLGIDGETAGVFYLRASIQRALFNLAYQPKFSTCEEHDYD